MYAKSRFSIAMLALCSLWVAASALAAESAKTQNTVITVKEMCGGCVKRITAKLDKMEDIHDIKCDVKAKTVTVVPEKDKTLSPRALWEVMDEIGKTPTKLTAPSGTFTSKPKE